MTHALKCWPESFNAIACGDKPFEIRPDDRLYQVGDELFLREWSPETEEYTSRTMRCQVIYLTRGLPLPEGLCVMTIKPGPVSCDYCGGHPRWGAQSESGRGLGYQMACPFCLPEEEARLRAARESQGLEYDRPLPAKEG